MRHILVVVTHSSLQVFMILMLFCVSGCFAQKEKRVLLKDFDSDIKSRTYVENPYLDKFEGKWQWEEGSQRFTVNFKKLAVPIPGSDIPLKIEMLDGTYEYYKNGIKSPFNKDNVPLLGTTNSESEPLIFFIAHLKASTSTTAIIEFVDRNTLRFQLHRAVSKENRDRFPLPNDMVLKRLD